MSAIGLLGVGKTYAQYANPVDRLIEAVTGSKRHHAFTALHPLDLKVERGEVLGLVGMNGAGKSTLLKLITGTILPSMGEVKVKGRVSALLELGAGFHPEMSGKDNVYLSGAVQGMTTQEIDAEYESIVQFSGLEAFIDQPVKTYSSGMFVRLAFAVATCRPPDILIVDEALSVGDGAFALKSFQRIMGFKDAGCTILFCSHSLYQVEAICSRVIWLHQGHVIQDGVPATVTGAYSQFVETGLLPGERKSSQSLESVTNSPPSEAVPVAPTGCAKLSRVEVNAGGRSGANIELECGCDDLVVKAEFRSDPTIPAPSLAVTLTRADGMVVASVGSINDGFVFTRTPEGQGHASVTFTKLPLLKGEYWVNVYLACDQAIHEYDQAVMVARLQVRQKGLEQGVVTLPHYWQGVAAGHLHG